MDGMTREALRLECLKLAVQMEGRSGYSAPQNVTTYADAMFDWVMTPQEAAATPQTKAKGK